MRGTPRERRERRIDAAVVRGTSRARPQRRSGRSGASESSTSSTHRSLWRTAATPLFRKDAAVTGADETPSFSPPLSPLPFFPAVLCRRAHHPTAPEPWSNATGGGGASPSVAEEQPTEEDDSSSAVRPSRRTVAGATGKGETPPPPPRAFFDACIILRRVAWRMRAVHVCVRVVHSSVGGHVGK